MGSNLMQNVSMEFIIEDEDKASEIVSKILEENGINDDEIESGLIWDTGFEECHISLISDPEDWDTVSVSFGNFCIYMQKYDCYISEKEIKNKSDKLREIGDKISEKYGIKYEIVVLGTFG